MSGESAGGRHLVWVPAGGVARLGDPPEGVVVRAIPEDPARHPDVGKVEFLILPVRADFRAVFPEMTSLRAVQTLSAGVDDTVDGIPAGVTFCSAKGVYDASVAEWVVGALIADFKMFPVFRDEQKAATWSRHATREVVGSKVMILGYGSIGKAVEQRLAGFGVEVTRVARSEREGVLGVDAARRVVGDMDVVVILLPLTPDTEGLVGREFLGSMKDGALLINAGRGRIMDSDALLDELRAGRLRAVLDVTDPEPLPGGHPFYQLANVFVTPHIAIGPGGGRGDAYVRVVGEQLRRFVEGSDLLNVVEHGY